MLVPRPETELLVDWALELLRGELRRRRRADASLDLGTGSGAIALAREARAARTLGGRRATDVSADALAVARAQRGAARPGDRARRGVVVAGAGEARRFDLVAGQSALHRRRRPAPGGAAPRAAGGADARRRRPGRVCARSSPAPAAHLRSGRLAAARARLRPGRGGAGPAATAPASPTSQTRPTSPAIRARPAAPAGAAFVTAGHKRSPSVAKASLRRAKRRDAGTKRGQCGVGRNTIRSGSAYDEFRPSASARCLNRRCDRGGRHATSRTGSAQPSPPRWRSSGARADGDGLTADADRVPWARFQGRIGYAPGAPAGAPSWRRSSGSGLQISSVSLHRRRLLRRRSAGPGNSGRRLPRHQRRPDRRAQPWLDVGQPGQRPAQRQTGACSAQSPAPT